MGEDALDALLKDSTRRRSRSSRGLRVSDILLMPEDQQSLVNALMRQYEASAADLATHLGKPLEVVQPLLADLLNKELLKTVQGPSDLLYRVRLAPKSGRQMPTDVWRVLESHTQQANVFISYSRRNKPYVQNLHAALEGTGREVWVDWENIPLAVDWWQEIQLGIELADTFVFVLSPDSVQSQVCRQEIDHAVQHNKRLVPVVCEDVQPDQVHPELSKLNWIFLRPTDDYEAGFKGLLAAIDQDIDYVRTHTRLLVRALEWDRNGRDGSYLLRGTDLQRANEYLAQGRDEEPRPTALHHQYVLASAEVEAATREAELAQQAATLQGQRQWLKAVTAVSILAIALGITSLGLYQQAQQARRIAEQARLRALTQSAEALFLSDQRFEALLRATQAGRLLTSLEGSGIDPTLRAQVTSGIQQALFWVQERNRIEGHAGTVWQVEFTPGGDALASVSADGTLAIWGLNGEQLAELKGNGSPLGDMDFAASGDRIAAVGTDGGVYLWNKVGNGWQQWDRVQQWKAHTQPTRAVQFSLDGRFVATASADASVKLWGMDGKLVRTFDAGQSGLQDLAMTPDGQTLIAGDERGSLYVWELQTGQLQRSRQVHPSAIAALDMNAEGNVVASAGYDGWVRLSTIPNGNTVLEIQAHDGPVHNVRFTADNTGIVTVGSDKAVRLWDLDGNLKATLVGHTGHVSGIAINPVGDLLATSGGDRAVRLWALDRERLEILQGHTGSVNAVAVSPDGRLIVSASQDQTLRLWRPDGELIKTLDGHSAAVRSITFSPDGTQFASASADGTLRLWSREGEPIRVLQGHVGPVNDVAFHPNGDQLASAGDDRTVRLWQTDGTPIKTLNAHRDSVLSVAFSPDGTKLVSTGLDHIARLWTPEGVVLRTLDMHRGWVQDASFSPDGKTLATASYDNTIKLWRVDDGVMLHSLEGHRDGVLSLSFHPDGHRLVSASNDNTLRFWSLDGTPLATLPGHSGGINDVTYDPQGKFVVSASRDRTVLVWTLQAIENLDDLLNDSCRWLWDYLSNNAKVEAEISAICPAPATSQEVPE